MVNVIGVRFHDEGKMFFFDPGEERPAIGSYVLVDTVKGTDLARVCMGPSEMDEMFLSAPLKPIIRVAAEKDMEHYQENSKLASDAYSVCQDKIGEHHLDMKLVRVEVPFDNSKMLFYFTANGRVDFRALVKDLAAVYHTRIELRQIGVRDEARMLGGLGPCGRHICCDAFLNDFQPVSIKMAKEQKLSLNPSKISGVCGRLMCCLKYEEDQYEAIHRRMPKVGKEIQTPDGTGHVTAQNILRESVSVRFQRGDSGEIREYTLDDLFPEVSEEKEQESVEMETGSGDQQNMELSDDEADIGAENDLGPESVIEQEERRKKDRKIRRGKPKSESVFVPETVSDENYRENKMEEAGQTETERKAPKTEAASKNAGSSWMDALKKAMEAAGQVEV